MNTQERSGNPDAGASRRAKPQKWRYAYFLLAALDLVTVFAGTYLNHQLMAIYTQSVEVHRVWTERVAAYSRLAELAAKVNAPGNNVFDNRQVQQEAVLMRVAERIFDLDLARQQRELHTNLDPEVGRPLLTRLDAIALAKTEMTDEAARIFDHFRDNRPDLAGQRMATMDHQFANLNAALRALQRAVESIQQGHFKEQTVAAAELQRYEYLIGAAMLLMILGAILYGHKMAQQMRSDADENERQFNALQSAEERTRSILDAAVEGIVAFDLQGRIESCNKAAEQLFGLEPGEAIGRDIRAMIPALADGMSQNGSPDDRHSPAAMARIQGGESTGRRRDGTEFPLEYSVSKVNRGQTIAYTGILRDLSDRRKAEEALDAAATAQAANRAKSQFLANMSHEIRTPMNGVLGMAEMLLDTDLTPTQRHYAESVHLSGESLLEIIDDILDISKIEAGKLELQCADFNLRELAGEVAQLLLPGAQKKGLEFTCSISDDIPDALRGAPSQLRQVLGNLVGNAIKFTDRGSVALKVSRFAVEAGSAAPAIAADESAPAALILHFAVQDTGIGIAASVQPRLFQAFTQADSSTTRRYGGTGLGLAISKELVEKMGGQIGVRSAPGLGAEFWFTVRLDLPLASNPEPAPAAPPGSELNGVRVLLAEDNPVNQDVARSMLNSLGCQVYLAENGVQALAALGHSRFDIVLMDRHMPQLDGFSTTAEIRARRLLRPRQAAGAATPLRLPIVGLTASALKGDREICIAAGMDDYLAKPIRRDALRRVLERWVLDRPAGHVDAAPRADEPRPGTLDASTLAHAFPPAASARAALSGRIVIAEDDAEFRTYLTDLLEGAGLEVDAHRDGAAALAACRAQLPDALLSDVSMPGLAGFELIAQLRADENTALMPVLLLSGRADEDERIAGINAGADDYLVKPLGGRELVARVEGAVRLARLRRETARRQQADFETLFSLAPDAIIVVDPEGKVLTANERAQQCFGYARQELQGLGIEALIPGNRWQIHVGHGKALMHTPSTQVAGTNRELRASRRDGSEFVAEISLAPLHFKNQFCTVANVRDVTERKRLEAERAGHEQRFRDMSRRVVEVQETERRQLSTELHDRTSPGLAAIQLNLNMLNKLLREQGTEDVVALLDDTAGLIADTTVSIREISANLRPTVLDDGGLLPALAGYTQQFTQRTGVAVHLHTAEATSALTTAVQSSLFRIIQEGLTNCAKHAKAGSVTIRLSTDDDRVTLLIADDGAGFDPDRPGRTGLGLLTMRERAEFGGGSFTLESNPGRGTRIKVLVPAQNTGTAGH